jgi:dolichol-phosphate mannosyltransferase
VSKSDKLSAGAAALIKGWIKFGLTCSVGLLADIAAAAVLVRFGYHPYAAALTGIIIGSVWYFALSSRFVWGRYGN